VVVADLQCCGNEPASWQEYRRRIEMTEIRRLIRQVLERTEVDGIVAAGDFNLVSTAVPLVILAGPYAQPHAGLIPAELYHVDGISSWTWDGRGTPYPSRALDFQMYTAGSLRVQNGYIFDSEDISPEQFKLLNMQVETSRSLSDHRPLVVDYSWR
jgi:endonuclease/exonuclease/phosphatase family metal-dependent hydrolase